MRKYELTCRCLAPRTSACGTSLAASEATAPVAVRMARSSPSDSATVMPVGTLGPHGDRRDVHALGRQLAEHEAAGRVVAHRGHEGDAHPEPRGRHGHDGRGPADHQGYPVDELLALAELGDHVGPEHQHIGVAVAHDDQIGGHRGPVLRHPNLPISARRVVRTRRAADRIPCDRNQ